MPHPFIRLLSRLSVGRKLLLIYLLDLCAVIYISGILVNEKFIAIDFTRKEIAGNSYIATLRDTLVGAARLDLPGAASPAPGDQAALLRAAQSAHGEGMQSAEASERLIRTLAEQPTPAALVRDARALLTRLGNQSNLILDPDLDSYYTMSLVVLRLPELLELQQRVGAHLRQAAEPAERRTQYLVLEGQLDGTTRGIVADWAEATAARPALKGELDTAMANLSARIAAFQHAARTAIDQPDTGTAQADLSAAQAALLDQIEATWQGGAGALGRLLAERESALYTRMWLHLGTALSVLVGILSLVYLVAQQIRVPLRRLSQVVDTVGRTGDHSQRAQWTSQDEIGRLVSGFNGMLEELDRARHEQQELAASARAAEAQHALLEATPIAIVVTAVPGHEVLHANAPADTWLAGRRMDPWAVGLDPKLRVRFFQQLSDRGKVDEFEVRWLGGAEPGWAVLSARRLFYQGQDAVLTAFTPINHLKLMERRLELWAKVYEASSEGILIVDAERRVLSANQAFYRSTGHDVVDVIGTRPEALFTEDEQEFDAMWAAVMQRGTWQGELSLRRRNGSDYPAWLMVSAVREPQGGVSHHIVTSIDISDRKKSEERIQYLAHHDVLTGLPNRALCVERLRLALLQAQRAGQQVAVLFIDLDRFKDINDSLGHHVGDGLLRSVARRLSDTVRAVDTVSRLGGDEFVVVLNGVHGVDEVAHLVEQRLIPQIRLPHDVDGAELHVSCSVGIALYPDDARELDTLMRHADAAMYHAKAEGRDGAQFFSQEMTDRAQQRLRLETALRQAAAAGQFALHWQPRVAAEGGALVGVEGLLRWTHPDLGSVPPVRFIPIAEESGLIVPIGAWVIEEACRQIGAWRAAGSMPPEVSINLSAIQLRDPGLLGQLQASMLRHGVPPGVLELELTESMLMDSAEASLGVLHEIRRLGIGLAIDDFGTGYSSLNYLNRFPIDRLKIDRSFVRGMLDDSTHRAVTTAVIGLGHTLGLTVVAEGVETEDQAAALRAARCDELQGYLYARPMSAEALAGWQAAGAALSAAGGR
ncbi:MAG: EAL domain-containing protein [Vitreoscilla sp.]|nr:EAL domain-containing protein [Vitreoscilla sp.]